MAIRIPERSTTLDLPGGSPNLPQTGYVAIGQAMQNFGNAIGNLAGPISDIGAKMEDARQKNAAFVGEQHLNNYQTTTASVEQQAALKAQADGTGLHSAGVQELQKASPEMINYIADLRKQGMNDLADKFQLKFDSVNQDHSINLRQGEYKMGVAHDTNFLKTKLDGTVSATTGDMSKNDATLSAYHDIVTAAIRLPAEQQQQFIADSVQAVRAQEAAIRYQGDPAGMAAATGVPHTSGPNDYFDRIRAIESAGNDNAVSSTGAVGRYQFTSGTWSDMMRAHPDLGLTANGRSDPNQQELAVRALTADNRATLTRGLGRAPTDGELYLAHQQGAGGALALLTNPDRLATDMVGRQAVAVNGGSPGMTAGQFANQWINRLGGIQTAGGVTVQTPPNQRYAMLDFKQRQDLYGQAVQDQRRFASDTAQLKAQTDNNTMGYFNLQIEKGGITDPVVMENNARALGLSDGDVATLVHKVNTEQKANVTFTTAMQQTPPGSAPNLDGTDPNLRKGLQNQFDLSVGAGPAWYDGGKGTQASQNFIKATGLAPESMINDIHSALTRGDVSALTRMLDAASGLGNDTGIYRDATNSKDVMEAVGRVHDLQALGRGDAASYTAQAMINEQSPEFQKQLKIIQSSPGFASSMKATASLEGFTQNAQLKTINGSTISYNPDKVFSDPNLPVQWSDFYTESMNKTGNHDQSIGYANRKINEVYTIQPHPDGTATAMRNSPTLFIQPIVDPILDPATGIIDTLGGLSYGHPQPSYEWINRQADTLANAHIAAGMEKSHTFPPGPIKTWLVSDLQTDQEANYIRANPGKVSGSPSYQIHTHDADGFDITLNTRFAPDQKAAKAVADANIIAFGNQIRRESKTNPIFGGN